MTAQLSDSRTLASIDRIGRSQTEGVDMINFAPTRGLAVLLAGAAMAGALTPGASAKPSCGDTHVYVNPSTGFPSCVSMTSSSSESSHRDDSADVPAGFTRRYVGSTLSVVPIHPVSSTAGSRQAIDEATGFDWPSAAIGAAAAGALLLILLAATVGVVRTRRGPLARRRAVGV
jgi:hypothetical protein